MEKNDQPRAGIRPTEDGIGAIFEAMFHGINTLATSKTVLGDPVNLGNAVLVPIMELSAGMASGSFGKPDSTKGAGGMSVKLSPVAMLVMENDHVRVINIKNQDIATKIFDLIPDAVDRILGKGVTQETEESAKEMLSGLGSSMIEPEEERR